MNNKILKMLIVIMGFAGLLSPMAHAQDSEKWSGWTVSGGITSHNKVDKQAYAATWSSAEESDVNVPTSVGIGVDHNNILIEYKLYPITFGEEIRGTKYEFYSGASVISVGYQF